MPDTKPTFSIYHTTKSLPEGWDRIARSNTFLSRNFLSVLERAAPPNMECHFIGLFKNNSLCGIALAQYIDLSAINTFAEKRSFCLKDYIFKKVSSHTLIIGNNMLTGQNAYLLDGITETEALAEMKKALRQLQKEYTSQGRKINLLSVKDFNQKELPDFKEAGFSGYYTFCTQPNMIFTIREDWKTIDDYTKALNTKYRTQYKRARKKAADILKRELSAGEIGLYEDRINELYLTVADNASFNTFHLPKGHFRVFKEALQDDFLFFGYFMGETLAGFSTLIKNGKYMDTYFLGYDKLVQKEKMLYLNMLYDMVGYAIAKGFDRVIFARSAMEIKSSVGAKAEEVYGIIKHTNPLLNLFMSRLFVYFDPKIGWKPRNPFK